MPAPTFTSERGKSSQPCIYPNYTQGLLYPRLDNSPGA